MSPTRPNGPYTDYDRYIAALAAQEESLEEDVIIPLHVRCRLCGTPNSVETWDGERRPCTNCGASPKAKA